MVLQEVGSTAAAIVAGPWFRAERKNNSRAIPADVSGEAEISPARKVILATVVLRRVARGVSRNAPLGGLKQRLKRRRGRRVVSPVPAA
jgi:hypothetical protein